MTEIHQVLIAHLDDLYAFYGADTGVQDRAQAHFLVHQGTGRSASFRHAMNQLPSVEEQLAAVNRFFDDRRSNTSICATRRSLAA